MNNVLVQCTFYPFIGIKGNLCEKGCTSNILIYISYFMYSCLVFQGYGNIKIIHLKKPLIFSVKNIYFIVLCSEKAIKIGSKLPLFFFLPLLCWFFSLRVWCFDFLKFTFKKKITLPQKYWERIQYCELLFLSEYFFYIKLQQTCYSI